MVKRIEKSGPRGRFAPGSDPCGPAPLNQAKDRISIEAMFDADISDDSYRRLRDAVWNGQIELYNRISLKDWKQRNSKLKKRLNDGLPCNDPEIFSLATAHHGTPERSELEIVHLMQKEILADERRYREVKKAGTLYAMDENGEWMHDFCWIEHAHRRTAAILSCGYILHDADFDVSLTDLRHPDRNSDDHIVPKPFEEFCFRYIFKLQNREIFQEEDRTQGYYQCIRDAGRARGKLFPER